MWQPVPFCEHQDNCSQNIIPSEGGVSEGTNLLIVAAFATQIIGDLNPGIQYWRPRALRKLVMILLVHIRRYWVLEAVRWSTPFMILI